MTSLNSAPQSETPDLIGGTCPPCRHFLPENRECHLVRLGEKSFLEIFDGKRCRPREFLEQFLTRRLMRRYGSRSAARHDAEEIASSVVIDLLNRPPERFFRSFDLNGQRQFLAARAVQREVDFRRSVEGRVRCGNCSFHHASGKDRRCDHPGPDHYWSGRAVKASEDPRRFQPPCDKYRSGRLEEGYDSVERADPALLASDGPAPEAEVAMKERDDLLVDCLAGVQRSCPHCHRALLMAFFEGKTNEEIAGVMGVSDKSIKRYRAQGLELLKSEMERRGISDLGAMEMESAH